MLRHFVIATLLLSCLAVPGWSQSPPPPATPAAPLPGKPVAKKPAPKAKPAAKPAASADSGPCQIGVISAIGDKFLLEHIGLTVFGNEFTDAPVESWGLDDLVVARARAAASGQSVKRITYARGAFDSYYHPPRELFRDARNDLVNVVRQVAANANCERYLVVIRSGGQVPNTNQSATGIGLLTNWASGTFKNAQLFAFIGIAVFDGKTFEKHENPIAARRTSFASGEKRVFRAAPRLRSSSDAVGSSWQQPAARRSARHDCRKAGQRIACVS